MSKLIIFSAPSGSGKSTIINRLMGEHPELRMTFSVSATSRPPRGSEKDGVEYHFMTPEQFRAHIDADDFIEYVEVYRDRFYGTLRSEVDGRLSDGQNVVFDVDVEGGCRIKEMYGDRALSVFIMPPGVDELRRRLEHRATDAPEVIDERVQRAEYEMSFAKRYDVVVVNDNLERAINEVLAAISKFV